MKLCDEFIIFALSFDRRASFVSDYQKAQMYIEDKYLISNVR